MKKSSWLMIGACVVLLLGLWGVYSLTQKPAPGFTEEHVTHMLTAMKTAVEHKDVRGIMSFVDEAPETRISRLNQDQTRLLLNRAFHQSGKLQAEFTKLELHPSETDATADFDLEVKHHMAEGDGIDYSGHITLHMRQVEVPHLLGLYHTMDWRITRAETTGPDLANYGDY